MTLSARIARTLAAGAALLAFAGPANAATYSFDLSGEIASGSYATFGIYRFFDLTLTGAETPIDLQVGDVFNLTVTLDGMLSVPSGTDTTFFGVSLRTTPDSLGFPAEGGVISSSRITFLDGDLEGLEYGRACSNCVSGGMSTGPNVSFNVSRFTTTITIENLIADDADYAGPLTVDRFELGYQATDLATPPVPEPGEWAMMGLGLLVTGAIARRRRAKA